MISGSSLLSRAMCLLLPSSALAGGSVSVNINDLVAVSGMESLNIQDTQDPKGGQRRGLLAYSRQGFTTGDPSSCAVGVWLAGLGRCHGARFLHRPGPNIDTTGHWHRHYDYQIADKVNGRASYEYNKDRLFPAAIAASTSTDTKFGRLHSSVAVDPQEMTANVEASLRSEEFGVFSTNFKANEKTGGVLGPLRWVSNPVAFPFAIKESTPMIISISHDINTKEGHLSLAAKLNNNLDGKLMLPSGGDPVATLVASHSPDKDSDIRASARVLDLLGSGIGKGAVGVTYRRDLDTVQGSSSKVVLEGRDTGDFGWSLSNTTRRTTCVLSGRGRFARRGGGGGVPSTVSLRQTFRFF